MRHRHGHHDVVSLAGDHDNSSLWCHHVQVPLTNAGADDIGTGNVQGRSREAVDRHRSIWEHLGHSTRKLVVIGAPGSGKTTLLKDMALGIKPRYDDRPSGVMDRLPILLFLRRHAEDIGRSSSYTLAHAAAAETQWRRLWFETQLKNGVCLVLLDGLDEIADPRLRQAVAAWVEQQMRCYAANPFVVTSRTHGAPRIRRCMVDVVALCPLGDEQARELVHRWYLTNERGTGRVDPAARMKAENAASALVTALPHARSLSYPLTPSLLTMMATVYQDCGAVPDSHLAVHEAFCATHELRRAELGPSQTTTVLAPLAYRMMREGMWEIGEEQLAEFLVEPLQTILPPTTPQGFIESGVREDGLFIRLAPHRFGFGHRTVQEYLAAVHIQERSLTSDIARNIRHPSWNETIRFYANLADASPIVEACLAPTPSSVPALVLSVQCVDNAKMATPSLRARFEERLGVATAQADASARRPVCEALLTRRLARMVAVDRDRAVSSLITNAEYQLFLDESRDAGRHLQPDHWSRSDFPQGHFGEPVAGIRATDAVEFCRWLSNRFGHAYRLPAPREVSAPDAVTVHGTGVGYWSRDRRGEGRHVVFGVADTTLNTVATQIRVFNLALDDAHPLARALSRAFARGLTRDPAMAFDVVPAETFGHALEGGVGDDVDLDLEFDQALSIATADLELATALALGTTNDLVRAKRLNLAQADARAFVRALVQSLDLDSALRALATRDRTATLLRARTARAQIEWTEVGRFLCRFLRWVSLLVIGAASASQTMSRLGGSNARPASGLGTGDELDQHVDHCLDFYVDLAVLEGRMSGQFPVIGGIRVVRDTLS